MADKQITLTTSEKGVTADTVKIKKYEINILDKILSFSYFVGNSSGSELRGGSDTIDGTDFDTLVISTVTHDQIIDACLQKLQDDNSNFAGIKS